MLKVSQGGSNQLSLGPGASGHWRGHRDRGRRRTLIVPGRSRQCVLTQALQPVGEAANRVEVSLGERI